MSIKVQVTGTSAAAEILRGHLRALDYVLVEQGGKYSVRLDSTKIDVNKTDSRKISGPNFACDEFAGQGWGIEMDAVNDKATGTFGEECRRAVAELSGVPVCWRNSESLNPNELHVAVPVTETGNRDWEDAAARGVLRAILKITRHGEPAWFGSKKNWLNVQGWWNKFKGRSGK